MKKIRGDKPIRVIIYTYMEISQRNSNISNIPKISQGNSQAKTSCFHFIFSLFSPTQLEKRRVEQVLPIGGRLAPVRGGRCWGKGVGDGIQCKYCVHTYVNAKMIPVETTPGIGGGWMNEKG
jgi:hypothetical protein